MASSGNTSNTTEAESCPIEPHLFDLGSLGPALAIIFFLAFLKQRVKYKLHYCSGRPGLLLPINFLGGYQNRFTIAATFGATANTCLELFLKGKSGIFILPGPTWVKVFQGIIAVLVYGIIFYPLFACLTTEHKLFGSLLGFLYSGIRFSITFYIALQCESKVSDGIPKKYGYLKILGKAPTFLCYLFIVMRFAVLLFFELKKKWLKSSDEGNEHHPSPTNLVTQTEIIYVKKLLSQENVIFPLSGTDQERWYVRLQDFIYKSRPDFKYSTQLISTLFVASIVVFQVLVSEIVFLESQKSVPVPNCSTEMCNFSKVLFVGAESGFIASAALSVLLMLHFMKCHREHVLQLYRGQSVFAQGVVVLPSKLVERSLRFSGYQIAYVLAGYSVMSFVLIIFTVLLAFLFKYAKQLFPALHELIVESWQVFLPVLGMAVFLSMFQLLLRHFVFRDRDFPNITVTVDNIRLYSIMAYFFFFYNILLGIFSFILRILKGMVLGVVFVSRIDRTCLVYGYQTWDRGFVAYLGFLHVLVSHRHPVLLSFCQLIIDRNKGQSLEESLEQKIVPLLLKSESDNGYRREIRHPRLSRRAANRWYVAVTLIRNPSLKQLRRTGRTRPYMSIDASETDFTVLV